MGGLPFRTQTAIRAEAAAAALAETNSRLVVLREQRNKLLLEDNDTEAAKLAVEIGEQERLAVGFADKERLLREQDAREAHEKRLRENEAKNKRIDALFDLRDEDVAKLAALEKQRVTVWRRVLNTNRKIVAAHSWTTSDLSACLLAPLAFNTALAHESFRLSHTPLRYGGEVEAPDAGQSLPGSRVPRHDWRDQPERIPPMKDAFAAAGEYGKQALRDKRPTAPVDVPVLVTATNGDAGAGATPVTNGGEPAQRSEAEQRKIALEKQMEELAKDPAREAEYNDVVRALEQVHAVLTAE
jgi:hypothetical protein